VSPASIYSREHEKNMNGLNFEQKNVLSNPGSIWEAPVSCEQFCILTYVSVCLCRKAVEHSTSFSSTDILIFCTYTFQWPKTHEIELFYFRKWWLVVRSIRNVSKNLCRYENIRLDDTSKEALHFQTGKGTSSWKNWFVVIATDIHPLVHINK
jgi:hypothetical protein